MTRISGLKKCFSGWKMGLLCYWISLPIFAQNSINRQKVVERHQVANTSIDTLNALTVGNGKCTITVDVTGLQTFPFYYKNGISLGLLSQWGWHSFPAKRAFAIEETLVPLASHQRQVPYARQWPKDTPQAAAGDYIRQNPHRIHLANIGFILDAKEILPSALKNIAQNLNPYTGIIESKFELEGYAVEVWTTFAQNKDVLAIKVKSDLLSEGRLGIQLKFPFPTDTFLDEAALFNENEHRNLEIVHQDLKHFSVLRKLDTTQYFTSVSSSRQLALQENNFGYQIVAKGKSSEWGISFYFHPPPENAYPLLYPKLIKEVVQDWQAYWSAGGIIDFGAVKDQRAAELERRMVLSMYLLKVNDGGDFPPQETGLTNNSWFGKPHMEMIWWHSLQFALWGHSAILQNQLNWYKRAAPGAQKIAERQGFEGWRWQKMTDNNGQETPSSVGSYLLWQQPHPIYFAEVLYKQNTENLGKFAEMVHQTAAFMADFAWFDTTKNKYILGPGVIAAQERFDPKVTYNPTFELAYWKWALEVAQQWETRQGKPRVPKWDEVLKGLSPLPVQDGLYLAAESATDSYTNPVYMTDHPSVLGALGMLPNTGNVDELIMKNTFQKIRADWHWDDTWGWDFPMVAMTATRLNMPEQAVDALLMPITTNTYLKNGHNYQTPRLRLYLPGNGGFMSALALMAAGWEGGHIKQPGFPKDWAIRWEGIEQMP